MAMNVFINTLFMVIFSILAGITSGIAVLSTGLVVWVYSALSLICVCLAINSFKNITKVVKHG